MKKKKIAIWILIGLVCIATFSGVVWYLQTMKTESAETTIIENLKKLHLGMPQKSALNILGNPMSSFRFRSGSAEFTQLTFSAPAIISDPPELIFSTDSLLVFVGYGERLNIGSRPKIDQVLPVE